MVPDGRCVLGRRERERAQERERRRGLRARTVLEQPRAQGLGERGAFTGRRGEFRRGEGEFRQREGGVEAPRRGGIQVGEDAPDQCGAVDQTLRAESHECAQPGVLPHIRHAVPRHPVLEAVHAEVDLRPLHDQREEFRRQVVRAQPLQEGGAGPCPAAQACGMFPSCVAAAQPAVDEPVGARNRAARVVDEVFDEVGPRGAAGRQTFGEPRGQLGPPGHGVEVQDVEHPGPREGQVDPPCAGFPLLDPVGRGHGIGPAAEFGGELGGLLLVGAVVPVGPQRRAPRFQSLGLCRTFVRGQGAEFLQHPLDVEGFREVDQLHRAVSDRAVRAVASASGAVPRARPTASTCVQGPRPPGATGPSNRVRPVRQSCTAEGRK
ncbi:hypothetical protein [Streptomyces sp. NPDC091217]|uniref:hypothetical protein n=1 Tax=Streptomyces sp. NPDC091217 TaxID=3365975 RepID=UPI0038157770